MLLTNGKLIVLYPETISLTALNNRFDSLEQALSQGRRIYISIETPINNK